MINAITFSPFSAKGTLEGAEPRKSIDTAIEKLHINSILFAPEAVQKNAQSEDIDFSSGRTNSDKELIEIINYAHDKGLKVLLKPTLNCLDGTWRAHINFFDKDVPCEPKWGNWFKSYTAFQSHFAEIAQKTGCEMFLPGCEMVNTDRREGEWRKLIDDLRQVYSGPISYNCDKYQEDNVTWWDVVDYISSSGYYPINDWDNQLDRIEKVVKKFNKPFFFAECGCMSTEGSSMIPNDWGLPGGINLNEQAEWYKEMFDKCSKRDFVGGFALWSWTGKLYDEAYAKEERYYDIYLKPAMEVVANEYGTGDR